MVKNLWCDHLLESLSLLPPTSQLVKFVSLIGLSVQIRIRFIVQCRVKAISLLMSLSHPRPLPVSFSLDCFYFRSSSHVVGSKPPRHSGALFRCATPSEIFSQPGCFPPKKTHCYEALVNHSTRILSLQIRPLLDQFLYKNNPLAHYTILCSSERQS